MPRRGKLLIAVLTTDISQLRRSDLLITIAADHV